MRAATMPAQEVIQIGSALLIGTAAAFLIGSTVVLRRRSAKAKAAADAETGAEPGQDGEPSGGFSRWRIAASAVLVIALVVLLFTWLRADSPKADPAPTPSATLAAEPARTLPTCEEAKSEVGRLYEQLLTRGGSGDVDGMTRTAETQLYTIFQNAKCFSGRDGVAVAEILALLRADPRLLAALNKSPSCRPVVKDAVRLLNVAKLRKRLGDGSAASALSGGFAALGRDDGACLAPSAVKVLEDELAAAPVGSL